MSPGFGAMRMPMVDDTRSPDSVPQPKYRMTTEGAGATVSAEETLRGLSDVHSWGILDFVNPIGLGYALSPREVAGFRPHRFRDVPSENKNWVVERIELIGTLQHESPRVYLSENLPRMDELSKHEVRVPDEFETAGMARLTSGDDLYVRQFDQRVRMVGAIRNTKQCLTCHRGQRGDLLGAFSYQLGKPR
jgi:hypothetical protein